MPGSCNSGLSPCPSTGISGSNANGLERNTIMLMKPTSSADVTSSRYGMVRAWLFQCRRAASAA